MSEMTRQDRAQEILKGLTERRDALSNEAYERSASDTFTVAFGRKMEEELAQLNSDLGTFSKEFIQELFATKVNDHTFTYRVPGPLAEQTQENYIRDKLGDDTEILIEGLKIIGVDVSVKAPILNEATLDTDSNNKTRAEQNQHYEGGLADPIYATNIAIEAICAAKMAGVDLRNINSESWEENGSRIKVEALKAELDEGTATVLEKLTSGFIRVGSGSGSGALYVRNDGRLYAGDYVGFSHLHYWAFGARPAPESKN